MRPPCAAQSYTHARGLLFPTFAEGYGMPLVEALSVGTPVIASQLPVFREVAGEFAFWFSGTGAADLADALARRSERGKHQARDAGVRLRLTPTYQSNFVWLTDSPDLRSS